MSSDNNGLFVFNEMADTEVATESEHLSQQDLAEVAEIFVSTLTDESVEGLIAQIRNRLLARHKSFTWDEHETKNSEFQLERQREILIAMIRSLGADWKQFIGRNVMDSLRRMHQVQLSERRNDSIVNQLDNSHVNAVFHLRGDEYELQRRRINQRSRETNICSRFCTLEQKRCDEVNVPLQSRQNHATGETNSPENVDLDSNSEADNGKVATRFRNWVSTINMNIVVTILVILFVAIMGFLGVFVFFIVNPTNVIVASTNETERTVVKLTKTISKSMPITAPKEAFVRTDYFKNYIIFSTPTVNNRSNYETTFLEEFLHEEAVVKRYMETNERCAQISVEIICCETFCEGILKEGHKITRYFPRYSQFCGAWRYEFSTAYICTRKRDHITITEFWSAKDIRFSHDKVSIANFQAIDYLPSHVAVILTKNSSNSHEYCLVNFNRRAIKQIRCHDIDFLRLEPMDISMKRHVVYLQHMMWAVVTSKLEKNYLLWTIYVFKDMKLIFKDNDYLFSIDSELVVFGESPIIKVCAIELKNNQEDKIVSCTAYKYEIQ